MLAGLGAFLDLAHEDDWPRIFGCNLVNAGTAAATAASARTFIDAHEALASIFGCRLDDDGDEVAEASARCFELAHRSRSRSRWLQPTSQFAMTSMLQWPRRDASRPTKKLASIFGCNRSVSPSGSRRRLPMASARCFISPT